MRSLPLDDVRVLDLSRLLPGGLCSLLLADLGADVVKIEAPPVGDYARTRDPLYESSEPTASSATFVGLNRNKRSICLNLKSPAGVAAFRQLVGAADVVLEAFRPGVLERLGLGYEELAAINPAVVLCSILGWAPDVPRAMAAGHDINYLAAMGLLSLTGSPTEAPLAGAIHAADSAGALYAVIGIQAALAERARSARGQHITVPMTHASLTMAAMTVAATLATATTPARDQTLWGGGAVCYQAYPCQDGWVALGALEVKFWREWCRGVGRDDLVDQRYAPTGSAVHTEVRQIFAARSRAYWQRFSEEYDCCLTVVTGLSESLRSPAAAGRFVTQIDQPGIEHPVSVLTSPIELSHTPMDPGRHPAPALGGHLRDVFRDWDLPFDTVDALDEERLVG